MLRILNSVLIKIKYVQERKSIFLRRTREGKLFKKEGIDILDVYFRCVEHLYESPFVSLTHSLTNVILKMSRLRDQKTLNRSLQSFTLLAFTYLCHPF